MTDDEIIDTVEAFQFHAGPLTAERRNRGFTLIHVATGTPIARLNPIKGHDGLFDILYWSLWKERWVPFGLFGGPPPHSIKPCASSQTPQFSGSPGNSKIKNAQSRA
jgi:hypothetical protein